LPEPLEIEVKLRFPGVEEALAAVEAAGAVEVRGRYFEDNRIFDNSRGELRERGALLRVRSASDGRGLLTYKEKVESQLRAKVRREWESPLPEPGTFAGILERAGFVAVYRYQKYRTVFRLGETTLEIDETPMGCFVEIEGSEKSVPIVAARMGASESDFIVDDYRTLYLAWLEERGLPPGDMVFPD
jgi:adenylate cyclase class 2